jgi:hypothetical protein
MVILVQLSMKRVQSLGIWKVNVCSIHSCIGGHKVALNVLLAVLCAVV